LSVHLTDVLLDDVEISRHATFSKHLNGHAWHGGYSGPVLDGLTDGTGVCKGVSGWGDHNLLLAHEVGHWCWWFLAVVATFWHDNE